MNRLVDCRYPFEKTRALVPSTRKQVHALTRPITASDVLSSAVDFHCCPDMIPYVCRATFLACSKSQQDSVRAAMWACSSSLTTKRRTTLTVLQGGAARYISVAVLDNTSIDKKTTETGGDLHALWTRVTPAVADFVYGRKRAWWGGRSQRKGAVKEYNEQ